MPTGPQCCMNAGASTKRPAYSTRPMWRSVVGNTSTTPADAWMIFGSRAESCKPAHRYRKPAAMVLWKRAIQAFFHCFGYHLYPKDTRPMLRHDMERDAAFLARYQRCLPYTMTNMERL